ncbi:tRNA (adenosine(37)-N6)-threonylcarbamoyltransferase complex ATPase subunit type 1 TsaE [Citricoccus sp. NR2]|uniref:tRNA (adenosine(37)-N6)-threonylcarbamoyltransferase complex ATPase subunit type 1 TsaE n=1 Tax=Citricoccus sp. NR2 TaxID=3004095 RepID=UPI0022DCFA6D|nr:tRNA (adenosine(37)-N6)-threonylcarbamoyltransferase complex ATPase subunit type 1 TsaE [Citricoccus sp. NR2]WBL17782.1 tRNA (adenosine(37)-N6)-threonylcarbamoyltransferase complex ATPase subunit type 1 TsaE [Citricoccus sp. NR2]
MTAELTGEHRIELVDLDATARFARTLAGQLRGGDVLILTGELGAGKTTFTQSLGAALGITDPITSPTFVIARHHRNASVDSDGAPRPDLVHVDAYRLESADALTSLDLESTLADSVTVIEWGRDLAEHLAGDAGWLDLELHRAPGSAEPTGPTVEGEWVTDFEDDVEEPRTGVLRTFGARFTGLNLVD